MGLDASQARRARAPRPRVMLLTCLPPAADDDGEPNALALPPASAVVALESFLTELGLAHHLELFVEQEARTSVLRNDYDRQPAARRRQHGLGARDPPHPLRAPKTTTRLTRRGRRANPALDDMCRVSRVACCGVA